jgi:hypothetical protein
VVQESDFWAVLCLREATSNGVVSQLAMLEFAAIDFVMLSHKLGKMLGVYGKGADGFKWENNEFLVLAANCQKLGLAVTADQALSLLKEVIAADPEAPEKLKKGQAFSAQLDASRAGHYAETLYSTLLSELRTLLFKAIPRERTKYNNSDWLKNSIVQSKFPTSFKELDRAGTCYSLGQSTASVFHSMRALEPALAALAKPFPGISPGHENWQNIIEQVESAVRSIGQQSKSQQKIEDEKFFGAATSHLYFVKNAWRNHVAHARDSYSDDEAVKILSHTLEFVESLCPRFQE